DLGLGSLLRIVVAKLLRFLLEDPHGLAHRLGRLGQLRGAEEQDQHEQHNQNVPRVVEKSHMPSVLKSRSLPPWRQRNPSAHGTPIPPLAHPGACFVWPPGGSPPYWARAAAASARTAAASAGGAITGRSSPSPSASRRAHAASGVRRVTRSRPSPSSVTSSHG